MKKRRIKIIPTIIGVVILVLILIFIAIQIYFYQLSPVSKNSNEVTFTIQTGNNYYSIADDLKKLDLIKSEFFYKLYIKLNKKELKAGTYKLNKNMSVQEIVDIISQNSKYNPNALNITFKEGKNMRYIAQTIDANTNNTEEQVYSLLTNKEYLNKLINNYWFLDESILNTEIYYSLEGYLYPNTYEFTNKDVSIEEIFKTMLDETDKKLSQYKSDLQKNNYSIHQILTLASIIELEGASSDDRAGVAGVFYNRLNSGWALGSDVTTYYASKVDMSERDLYQSELNSQNAYNTRSTYLAGKLPVGPICNPSVDSIKAALYPETHDYYYFVADKNKETYFTKTNNEHLKKKQELIEAGLWFTYE